jgi:hypothetical protein
MGCGASPRRTCGTDCRGSETDRESRSSGGGRTGKSERLAVCTRPTGVALEPHIGAPDGARNTGPLAVGLPGP